jgi:hypothetical protein
MAQSPVGDRRSGNRWREAAVCHRADLIALALLTGSLAAVAAYLVAGGVLISLDAAVALYPMYVAIGERLSHGELPLWNPWQFSGTPLAADPQSGWLNLPVMALFALLPFVVAIPILIVVHLALAGFGAYALARGLGLPPSGGLVAGLAYSQSGWFLSRVASVTSHTGAVVWLPLAILGIERAARRPSALPRLGWWTLAGFALSQSLGAWLGQGAYYVLLAAAGFLAYRTVVDPPDPTRSLSGRAADLLLHGGAVFGIAFGLAAAGVLPRWEFLDHSNLAEGYATFEGVDGGWTIQVAAERLLGRTSYYAGSATLVLAAAGLALAGRRYAAPYWAALIGGSLFLASERRTVLHDAVAAVLPRFEEVQRHLPERVVSVAYLGTALLAGAAVAEWRRLAEPGSRRRIALAGIAAVLGLALWVARTEEEATWATLWPAVAAVGLLAIAATAQRRAIPGAARSLVIVVLLVDLLSSGRALILAGEGGLRHYREDLTAFYGSTPAADFLRAQGGEPFRYVGYDPTLVSQDAEGVLYRRHFGNSWTQALLVNNRATILQIDDVQGQDAPAQIQRYVEYLAALNGRTQDYHEAGIYPSGLSSPLLDLLNVRFVIVPNKPPVERPDLAALEGEWPAVYEDGRVKILENPEALPRVWLVHAARQVERGEALPLLASGAVDPRTEALLEAPPPPLAAATRPDDDHASVVRRKPERIEIRTRSDAPGLLVLSEIAYPAWRAYVDGEPVRLYVADHALRAVALPAGEHVVELRYESWTIRAGLAIGAVTVAALIGGALAAWYVERRRGAGYERPRR